MDHDSQLIWETYINTLDPELIQAVKQALEKGHTFTKIASDLFITVHMVKRIAGDKSGIGPDMDVTHPRGHVPGIPFNKVKIDRIMRRIAKAWTEREAGRPYETWTNIADAFGVSKKYISKLAVDAGYRINKPQQTQPLDTPEL